MFWVFFKILSHSAALTEAEIEIRSIMQAHVLATVLLLIQEGNCRLVSDRHTEPNLPVEQTTSCWTRTEWARVHGPFLGHSLPLNTSGYMHYSLCKDYAHLELRSLRNDVRQKQMSKAYTSKTMSTMFFGRWGQGFAPIGNIRLIKSMVFIRINLWQVKGEQSISCHRLQYARSKFGDTSSRVLIS